MVRIKELRLAHNLTLSALCERIGEHGVAITDSGLSNVENGRKRASDRLLAAWARALGLHPLDVWQGPIRSEGDTPEDAASIGQQSSPGRDAA
jgi:transcriptional regulator with XRE-family HTH domain